MNKKILAKLKDGTFVNIFDKSNPGFSSIENMYNDVYARININKDNTHLFDSKLNIHADEWFYINLNDSQKTKIIDPFFSILDSTVSINNIKPENYKNIVSIFLIEKEGGNEKIFLTRIFPRFYTMSKKILKWESGPALEEQASSIDFNGNIDAYWDGSNLFFKKYDFISKPIFDGIEFFYRIAKDDEVNNFLNNGFFEVQEDFNNKKLGERLLKNIADIIDNMKINFSDNDVRKSYNNYAKEFLGEDVKINSEGKFKVEKNNDLSNVIKLLQGHYYLDYINPKIKKETNYSKVLNK